MKIKKHKKLLIGLLMFSLLATYVYLPPVVNVNAVGSISSASDLMTDTDPFKTSTHTFTFTVSTTTPTDGYWRLEFQGGGAAGFTTVGAGSEDCAWANGNFTASTTAALNEVDCVWGGAPLVGTTSQIVITGITNPETEGTKTITMGVYSDSHVLMERVTMMVAIVEDVLMTATVASTLSFTVAGTSSSASVNNVDCDLNTTATTTAFGTLNQDTQTTVCQGLTVTSNAADGYSVTVWADGELTADGGANINSFDDSPTGFGSSTADLFHPWESPSAVLDNYDTYGHLGLTSSDGSLDPTVFAATTTPTDPFNVGGGTPTFAGFAGNTPIQVMYHDGPTTGTMQGTSFAAVAYSVEISGLQEAGDYETTLTYIATPIY